MTQEIIIVSGLPRSGTSLLMQMLAAGGVEILTDRIRAPDVDNPRGYYELEKVKQIKRDASWLPAARGKAFKMVSQLLYDLPATERYRIVFIERDFDEMLASQEKMLARLGRPSAPRDTIREAFTVHLRRLRAWLAAQPNMAVEYFNFNELVAHPRPHAERICSFLGGLPSLDPMIAAVDPSLYRNRATGAAR